MVKMEATAPATSSTAAAAANSTTTSSSNQSGSNDFVKKLFQMLQEVAYKDVVTWTTNGDSFVVLNTNEFTKEILPRHFKHSNFASFVRQLNKYDFHKVKIPNEEKQNYKYGEDAWEFKHPDFRINDREALENIKRKGPTTKKGQNNNNLSSSNNPNNLQYADGGLNASGAGNGNAMELSRIQFQQLSDEINSLRQDNKTLFHELKVMQVKYKAVVDNIMGLKNFDERSFRSMGTLINCLEQAGIKLPPLYFPNPNLVNLQEPGTSGPVQAQAPIVPPDQQQPAPHAHSHSHSNSITQLASPNLASAGQAPFHGGYNTGPPPPQTSHVRASSDAAKPIGVADPTAGVPKQQLANPQQQVAGPAAVSNSASPDQSQITITNLPNPKFHVLLVEDDNVCIQLCRKFLVKYGCQVTVATDGLNAISTVEHTRYDLVLMDIVMPNLDGATATSVIRSFDTKTPIIAMTGNIEEHDLVSYLENGMSDILAKPFTKEDLYNMLSKHLLTPNNVSPDPNNGGAPGIQGAGITPPVSQTQPQPHPGAPPPSVAAPSGALPHSLGISEVPNAGNISVKPDEKRQRLR